MTKCNSRAGLGLIRGVCCVNIPHSGGFSWVAMSGDSEMLVGIYALPSQWKDWDVFSWADSFVLMLSLGRRKPQRGARAPSHPSGFSVPPSLCCWAWDGASGDAHSGGDASSEECWRAPPAHPAAWPQGSVLECRWSQLWGRAGDLGQESLS